MMTFRNTENDHSDPVQSLPAHRAEDLTGGGKLALISLGNQVYTLRITRAGKLILTK